MFQVSFILCKWGIQIVQLWLVSIDVNEDIICVGLTGQGRVQFVGGKTKLGFSCSAWLRCRKQAGLVWDAEFSLRFFLVWRVQEEPPLANGH